MSFRLTYDAFDLHRAADMLEQAVESAHHIEQDAGRLAGCVADCGHGGLAGAAEDFLDVWGYGMKIIAADAEELGEALREAVTAYESVDQAGADELRQLR